jgi:DNA-binding NarL/FixJ family response regulator
MKLLIADDSAGFRERTRNLALKHSNVQIIGECSNGAEAMALISEKNPDMIILDIRMPLMNGIQVLKKLRMQGAKTIVCILSSYSYPQYKNKCMALGADYFFNKSDDFDKINMILKMY